MSGSSNIDAFERNAKWTLDSRCECDTMNYFSTQITWEEVPLWTKPVEGTYWAGRFALGVLTLGLSEVVNGGVPRPTHHDVEVLYECVRCGHEFRRTYELTLGGKQRENGYYREVRKEKRRSERRLAWSSVERCFASMWDHYHVLTANCAHWAREFYEKLEQL
ncbi:hypothetical protein AAVH_25279 [Aphelenchoides avenae]|nr:hypothetical protein AAVH_25279 [Aphelenchus avenae]